MTQAQSVRVGTPVETVAELRKGIMKGCDVSFGSVMVPNEMARKMPLIVICDWFELTLGSDHEINPSLWAN